MNLVANSHYGKYVNERLGASVIENEAGFVVFKMNNKELFIVEFFVDSSVRKNGHGRALVELLVKKAEELGALKITATIYLFDKNASSTLVAAIKCGFKLSQAHDGCIYISKDLGGNNGK